MSRCAGCWEDYTVIDKIGEGAYGVIASSARVILHDARAYVSRRMFLFNFPTQEVFKATHIRTGRTVALKKIYIREESSEDGVCNFERVRDAMFS